MKLKVESLNRLQIPEDNVQFISAIENELNEFIKVCEGYCDSGSSKRDKQNLNRLLDLYENDSYHFMKKRFDKLSEKCKHSLCNMTINFHENGLRLAPSDFDGNEVLFHDAAKILVHCKANKKYYSTFRALESLWCFLNYKYPSETRYDKYKFVSELIELTEVENLDSVQRSFRRYKNR
ncbi:hypothetical protein HC752_24165 [Vibrio sp. S9_S30]|uniref:hypothetical protein n=1 Tax=Vibrio sp. S9_S30 TaxID=2720226 RepID=UPI001680A721|nr:hypothetical protein [Vibrio sp. S9_S30]MBD1560017.1 hypothetical protein [Vibrio sp. S9_S30]